MKLVKQFKNFINILGTSYKLLLQNDPLRLAGATAFFTTFALPPILLLLIQLLSLIFNKNTISSQLFSELSQTLGKETVSQVVEVLDGIRGLASNWAITTGGFIFLLFVATTLFKVIQGSLNQVWMIRRSGEKKIKMALLGRFKSTMLILFTGLLFLTSVLAESLKVIFGHYLEELLPATAFYLNGTISTLISIITVWVWFSIIFRYLPDGRPTWKVSIAGALLTSILFNAGTTVVKWLLVNSNIGIVYGTSASIVLLLLFVFYASMIFYFGAAFTKEWGKYMNHPIVPNDNATLYENSDMQIPV